MVTLPTIFESVSRSDEIKKLRMPIFDKGKHAIRPVLLEVWRAPMCFQRGLVVVLLVYKITTGILPGPLNHIGSATGLTPALRLQAFEHLIHFLFVPRLNSQMNDQNQ